MSSIYINGHEVRVNPYDGSFFLVEGRAIKTFKSLDAVKAYLVRKAG